MVPADGPRCETCWMPVDPPAPLSQLPAYIASPCAASAPPSSTKPRPGTPCSPSSSGASPPSLQSMARSMARCPRTNGARPSHSIVPVPLSGQRRRLRGYNQSELLAKEVSRLTGIPLARRALVRGGLTPLRRLIWRATPARRTSSSAFRAGQARARGGCALLIDDVITTGATLDACARVLLSEGVDAVFALTFARED